MGERTGSARPWTLMGNEERRFDIRLGSRAWIDVRRKRDFEKGLDWAAVLTVKHDGQRHAVYVYDNAHGSPERHRILGGVKQRAETLPSHGSARLDLPAAVEEIKASWEGMVERWQP
jgi:hypothetical protein